MDAPPPSPAAPAMPAEGSVTAVYARASVAPAEEPVNTAVVGVSAAGSGKEAKEVEVNELLVCPISQEIMDDPVVVNGYTMNFREFLLWCAANEGRTVPCPFTKQQLKREAVVAWSVRSELHRQGFPVEPRSSNKIVIDKKLVLDSFKARAAEKKRGKVVEFVEGTPCKEFKVGDMVSLENELPACYVFLSGEVCQIMFVVKLWDGRHLIWAKPRNASMERLVYRANEVMQPTYKGGSASWFPGMVLCSKENLTLVQRADGAGPPVVYICSAVEARDNGEGKVQAGINQWLLGAYDYAYSHGAPIPWDVIAQQTGVNTALLAEWTRYETACPSPCCIWLLLTLGESVCVCVCWTAGAIGRSF